MVINLIDILMEDGFLNQNQQEVEEVIMEVEVGDEVLLSTTKEPVAEHPPISVTVTK